MKHLGIILVVSFIVIMIVGILFAINYNIIDYECKQFSRHVMSNEYTGQVSPYETCMIQNGQPIIKLPDSLFRAEFPNWNKTNVWIED